MSKVRPSTQLAQDGASTSYVLTWDGTKWTAAAVPSTTPTGAAGGDLTGTYPNPTLALGTAHIWTAEQAAPDFKATGLTGATNPTRYVGGTTTGHPTTGTFIAGDFVVTADGHIWVCSTGGSPGTWVDIAGSGGSGYATVQDEGTSLTARTVIDFAGAGVTATDDAANSRTLVTIPGGGGSGAVTKIAETVLSATAATIAFSSIPSSYRYLTVVLSGRTNGTTGGISFVGLQFNGDTASNYDTQVFQGAASAASASGFNGTFIRVGEIDGFQSSPSPVALIVDIPAYASTSWHKAVVARSADKNSSLTDTVSRSNGGWWRSTSAVNQVTLLTAGNSNIFAIGTIATLYGVT